MCKIIVFTNTSKFSKIDQLADKMRDLIKDQKDGFGYAVQNEDFSVFGARTLRPHVPLSVGFAPWCTATAFNFGEKGAGKTRGAMFHGRISTNNVSLSNTHPISKTDWHLIHNGVVTDKDPLAPGRTRVTSNDSEFVLDHLMSGGIADVAEHLTGYYAAAAFSPDGTLHIFRDNIARLSCAYSEKLESYIFATTPELIDQIGAWCEESLWSSPMLPDTYLRFVDGKCVEQTAFNSRGYGHTEASWAQSSLGFNLASREVITPSGVKARKTEREAYVDKYANPDSDYIKNWKEEWRREDAILENLCDSFLDLIDTIDDSYSIVSELGNIVTAKEFSNLRLIDQTKCVIRDFNGNRVRKFKKNKNGQNKEVKHVSSKATG